MIVLDASFLIAYADQSDAHHDRAVRAMVAAAERELPLVASALTLAEALVGPARSERGTAVMMSFRRAGVQAMALPADAALPLAKLRASTRLPIPDCCVLLAALSLSGAVATFDERLARELPGIGLVRHE